MVKLRKLLSHGDLIYNPCLLPCRHIPLVGGHFRNGVQAATCVNCGNFFKFKVVAPFKSTISLTVNGKQYTGRLFANDRCQRLQAFISVSNNTLKMHKN